MIPYRSEEERSLEALEMKNLNKLMMNSNSITWVAILT